MHRVPSRTGRSGFFATPPPRILAHRGLALDAPENTLLAFAKALAIGVNFIETDVHESSDGVAMISHDASLERTAGRLVDVNQLTAAELRRVDLGEGQNFASLAEALDAFPDARFNIDVKSPGAVQPTISAIQSTNAVQRVLVASFSDARRRDTVAGLPGVATSAPLGAMARIVTAMSMRMSHRAMAVLDGFDAVQVPERWKGVRVVTPRLVRVAHAVGAEVHVWTINDADSMNRLLDLGVDGIVTDRADIARDVVRQRP